MDITAPALDPSEWYGITDLPVQFHGITQNTVPMLAHLARLGERESGVIDGTIILSTSLCTPTATKNRCRPADYLSFEPLGSLVINTMHRSKAKKDALMKISRLRTAATMVQQNPGRGQIC